MQFVSKVALVALGFIALGSGQLTTIGVVPSGSTRSSSTSASSAFPTSSSLIVSSTSATSSTSPATTSAPDSSTTDTGNNLILTTIFTQPSGCDTGITAVPSWASELWQNIVNPVPTLTLTSCYPSQFYYSAIATAPLPPFTQLVCPNNWETYNVTETYIICCPRGYWPYTPNYNNTDRPGLGAVCFSSIWPDILMDITSYDATALATTIYTTAGVNGTVVFATAYDGTLATAFASSTTTASSTVTSTTSTVISSPPPITSSVPPTTTVAITTATTTSPSLTAISQLPSCGQTCFSNMLGQYASLGCSTEDPSCVCQNINFYYGIRDCANGACGTEVASTVIAFESGYCSSAIADHTTFPITTTTTTTSAVAIPTSVDGLPSCGQTCFSNMEAQYSTLGCSSPDPACLCENINFYYGIRDCSNGACGTAVASTVIAFESVFCASATAAPSSS